MSRSYTAFGAGVSLERFGLQQRYVAMSDLTPETRPPGQTGLLIATVIVIVVAIAAGLVWKQARDRNGPGSTTTAASQAAPAQNGSTTTVSQNTQRAGSSNPSLEQLKDQVKDLEAARQSLSQQLDATRQQLSEHEGDIKLLSQQLGGLSERVDGLSGSRASMLRGGAAGRRKQSQSR